MSKVEVNRTEYEALCDLRDGEHERMRVKALQFEEHYRGALAVNKDQLARLTSQDLQLDDMRRRNGALEREVSRLNAEIDKYKPATFSVAPPGSQTGARRTG